MRPKPEKMSIGYQNEMSPNTVITMGVRIPPILPVKQNPKYF